MNSRARSDKDKNKEKGVHTNGACNESELAMAYLDVAGAFTDASERRNGFGRASGIAQDVNDRC